MNELDVYYRALFGYRKQTATSVACSSLRSAIAKASVDTDKITVKTATCIIENDWIDAIEAGLEHIEKAIKMERQFIRSNGDVVPIEKVKHVSKESVEHLAKHSNLITRYEEGEDIVPDKLYTVERLNDYTVYENRFLYMLLCYLRDFITVRYDEILELTNRYEATLSFDKRLNNGKQNMSYSVSMHDVRRDDPYLRERNPAKDTIDKIDGLLRSVLAFLSTPLMEEVSKVPMIKPPITKTNVLKMNNTFKAAVALYEFIVSYDKKGYEIQHHEKTVAPFRDETADEIAEAGGMLSFLTYQWGLGIKQELKESYKREEERRAAEEIKQRAERIASMKRRLKNAEVSIEDYVLELEKQLRALEGESERAVKLAKEVDRLRAVEKAQLKQIDDLKNENSELKRTISDERQRHFEEIEALKKAHEDAIHELMVKHENEIAGINAEHAREIERLTEEHAREIEELKAKHESEIAELNERMRNAEEQHRAQIEEIKSDAAKRISVLNEEHEKRLAELTGAIDGLDRQLSELRDEHEKLTDAKRISDARLKAAIGVEYDLTDRESFNELEREFNAFRALYKEQWAKTKRKIRKNHLNMENIRRQDDQGTDTD